MPLKNGSLVTRGFISMKFTVNGLKWCMEYVSADNISMNNDGGKFLGLTEYDKQYISIRTELSQHLTRQTVIHELSHCFLFSYGISCDWYDEEQVCNFIGSYADQIIRITDKFMKGS